MAVSWVVCLPEIRTSVGNFLDIKSPWTSLLVPGIDRVLQNILI